jgi:thioredoxin reductase/SAM-dependent methyltransferase
MIVFPPAPEAFFLLILQELLHNCKPGADYGGMREEWEVIIVGGGVAGLSAALTLGRSGRRVLVVDGGAPRNRFAAHMHGMLGNDGLEPAELLRRGREELGAYDVTVRTGRISSAEEAADGLVVAFDDGETASTRALIAASGLSDVLPEIPGMCEQWGTGVLHCPYCHGWEVRGQRLAVLGTSPMSLHQAQLLRQWSDRLIFFTAGCGPIDSDLAARLRSRGVRLVDSPVTELLTDRGRLTGVRLGDGDSIELDAMFTAPILRPNDRYLADLGLQRTENAMGDFIAVDPVGQTSHPRVWAIGNIVNPGANVPVSIGAGSMTGGVVNMALVTEEFDRAVEGADPADLSSGPAEHRETESAEDYWEGQYAESSQRWSGRVNPATAEVAAALPVPVNGSALDLGCGEGGDAVWLAKQGWQVTAVDISATAIARGIENAREAGAADAVTWVSQDLSAWVTEETFDLVTASYFHSSVELPRTEILRRAAARVRRGGHLLIVSHVFETPADIPAWALRHHETDDPEDPQLQDELSVLLTPDAEVAELDLDEADWQVVRKEIRPREATGPDGDETATVKDGIVLLRRA